jgi:hypothetical protein
MNKLNSVLRRLRCGSTARGGNRAMALAIVLGICPTSAFPETQVRGSPEAVRIEAKNASIEEILTALRSSFGLQYQSTGKLEKQVTGTYAGPLQRVLVRLLEGNDFFLKTVDGRIEVTVLETRQPTLSAAASSPAPASSKAATTVPAAPAAIAARTRVADAQVPAATSAEPPSLAIKVADVSASVPGPILVAEGPVPVLSTTRGSAEGPVPVPSATQGSAEGPVPVPSATQGSAVPTLKPTLSSVAPPTASSASVQGLVPSPTSIAP